MKSGERFSRKAATPSLPSPREVWNIARESAMCASSGMWSSGAGVDQPLGQRQRNGGAVDDEGAGQLERGRDQVVGLVDAADEPTGEGRLGGEDVGGVDPLERLLGADDARQEPRRARLGHDAEPAEDEADPGPGGRQAQVHGQRHRRADADRGAVDGGDHGLGAGMDRQGDLAAGVADAGLERLLRQAFPQLGGGRGEGLVEPEDVALGREVHARRRRPCPRR